MIAFRQAHPVLRNRDHLQPRDYVGSGYPDIIVARHAGLAAPTGRRQPTLAFMLCGGHAKGGTVDDDFIYVAMNMHWESHDFELPALPDGSRWHVFANTGMPSPAGQLGARRRADPWRPGSTYSSARAQ